jgi:hypothetical protein
MHMDIDARYPELSALAQAHRRTLKNIGESAIPKRGAYLGFGECCYLVLHDYPTLVSAYSYLHTLNEFVHRNPAKDHARKTIWNKMNGNGSAFLDTVVEAAWALCFWDKGYPAEVEKNLTH